MPIYTKTGDKGETSLIGGTRVPKNHDRIEVYGTLDELNSFVGLLRDLSDKDSICKVLLKIQQNIFIAGTSIATDSSVSKKKVSLTKTKEITSLDIKFLEKEIDALSKKLPALKSFVLPGGHPLSSYAHIARTLCRRAERLLVKLHKKQAVNPEIIVYLNRLSDYFFVLARWFVYYYHAEETTWKA